MNQYPTKAHICVSFTILAILHHLMCKWHHQVARFCSLYHEHDPSRVEIQFDGRCHGLLTPVDLNVNCRVKRRDRESLVLESMGKTPVPSGKLSFQNREDA